MKPLSLLLGTAKFVLACILHPNTDHQVLFGPDGIKTVPVLRPRPAYTSRWPRISGRLRPKKARDVVSILEETARRLRADRRKVLHQDMGPRGLFRSAVQDNPEVLAVLEAAPQRLATDAESGLLPKES